MSCAKQGTSVRGQGANDGYAFAAECLDLCKDDTLMLGVVLCQVNSSENESGFLKNANAGIEHRKCRQGSALIFNYEDFGPM